MICDLCKREFDEQAARHSCHTSCGTADGCQGVRCPYCYYEVVPQFGWMRKLSALLRGRSGSQVTKAEKKEADGADRIPLALLRLNERARIAQLDMGDRDDLHKIIALGVLPGAEVVLIQRFPSLVFQIGHSQFSIDSELASRIHTSSC